jgi:hypothetical protein
MLLGRKSAGGQSKFVWMTHPNLSSQEPLESRLLRMIRTISPSTGVASHEHLDIPFRFSWTIFTLCGTLLVP